MITITIFIVSGALTFLFLVGQYMRLRFTDYVHHGHETHPVTDLLSDIKAFFLGLDRNSTKIFFRVLIRLVFMAGVSFIQAVREAWKSFLSNVRANDVRKHKGSVSFYLKHVTEDKKARRSE